MAPLALRQTALAALLLVGAPWLGAPHAHLLAPRPPLYAYPATRVAAVVERYHGEAVADPFRWLEDGNTPEVKAWVKAQNALTEGWTSKLPHREPMKQLLMAQSAAPITEAPVRRGDRLFFEGYPAGSADWSLMMQQGLTGEPQTLLSLPERANMALDWWEPSPGGRWVAYGISTGGDEQSVLRLVDTRSGAESAEAIAGCRLSSVGWLPDESGFYYTRFDRDKPSGQDKQRVYFHALGADPQADPLVFEYPAGPEHLLAVQLSEGGRYVLVTVYRGTSPENELYVMDRARPGVFRPLATGFTASYTGAFHGDRLYLRTDHQAPNGKIMRVDLAMPERAHWVTVVPERREVLEEMGTIKDRLVATYLKDAHSAIRLFSLDGEPALDVPLPGLGTAESVSGDSHYGELFIAFSSFLKRSTLYRYDTATGTLAPFSEPPEPLDVSDLVERQVWLTSKDGTRVPMFLVHRADLRPDGRNPTLLTGYGGFGSNQTPSFDYANYAWLRLGGVIAVPNLRGGGEFGEAWHRAGMLKNKQNTFDDFVAAAEWLIGAKITSPERLAIEGDSNGGLLVGAAITQRPELFKAAVCSMPLTDMLRYHRFMLGNYWIPEFGTADRPDDFKTLKAYSPYHRVKAGTRYPATLFVAGQADSRVDPLHSRKMAARVQAAQAGGAPIFLYLEPESGHGGHSSYARWVESVVMRRAFLAWQLRI